MRKRGFCGRCYPAPVIFRAMVQFGGTLSEGKRGVRFFTHASRRKNLKREAARGGWIFTPCPRLALPYFRPVARGTFAAFGAVFGFAVAVGAVRSGAVRRLAARSRLRFRTRPRSAFPHFSERARARRFAAVVPPRSFGSVVSRATLIFGLLPLDSDVVGCFASSCGFGYAVAAG